VFLRDRCITHLIKFKKSIRLAITPIHPPSRCISRFSRQSQKSLTATTFIVSRTIWDYD